MSAEERALAIVNHNNLAMLGTVDEKGKPFIKAMLYVKNEGLKEFWFCSNTSSKRGRQIADNPSACLYNYEGYEGVMLTGNAENSYDTDKRQAFWDDNMH